MTEVRPSAAALADQPNLWIVHRLGTTGTPSRLGGRMTYRGVGNGAHGDRMTTWTRGELGAFGEQLAVEHLVDTGLRIVSRNWRCRYGELDVVAADEATDTVVFVEVKTRTGDGFGGLAQAVTERKVRRLRRLAALWLSGQDRSWAKLRIDVIGVRLGRRRTPEITHLQGIG